MTARPAPLTPLAASTIRLAGSTRPASTSGFSAKDGRGRIASRRRHRLRAPDRVAMQLGNAVDEPVEQVRGLMRLAIPSCINLQDHAVGSRRQGRPVWRQLARMASAHFWLSPCGKRGEDEVDPVECIDAELLDFEVCESASDMRMHCTQLLPGLAVAEQARCLDARGGGTEAGAVRRRHSRRLQGSRIESWDGGYGPVCIHMQVNA